MEEITYTRSKRKAYLDLALGLLLLLIGGAAFWVSTLVGAVFFAIILPPTGMAAARLLKANRGGLLADSRGLRDVALPYGWISWSDITDATCMGRSLRVVLHMRQNRQASIRLNKEKGMTSKSLPDRVVIDTANVSIGAPVLLEMIRSRSPKPEAKRNAA